MIYIDGSLRILHLNDLHFGIEGRNYHNGYLQRNIKYVTEVIINSKPDLIIAGGDNILSTGINGLTRFVKFMDSFKVKWTFVFGNHDCEDKDYKEEYSEFLFNHSKKSNYLLYIQEKSCNFSIKVYNKNIKRLLNFAIIIMDSGIHDGTKYEGVSFEQVLWYKNEINLLQKEYNKDSMINTLLFTHMQCPEFYEAYKNSNNFIIKQELDEEDIEEIKNGGPQEDGGIFNAIVEMKSTKAYFVAHAHILKFQCMYKDVLLGFGPQSGHCKLFKDDDKPRETYLYVVDEKFNISTISYKENLK